MRCCALALALGACSKTTTNISQSFRNPGYEESVFQKLLVIGVASTQDERKAFEDAFASAIANEGGRAEASWTLLPESTQLSEERIHEAVDQGGFDGVLITRVLSVDKDTQYTPPKAYNRPRTTYYAAGPAWGYGFGGYYGFYGTTFAEVHEPGYFDTSTTVRLETNLYAVATSDLVWTAQSETVDPESVADIRASMTQTVAKKLKDEKLIP